ncbi:MAG: ATP-dependent sacrificial sulfur transferase LarE [Candidatus Omnitrophota bacterium]
MLAKLNALKQRLADLQSVLVAFSGGADSLLLLVVARSVLENRCCAVTASSELFPQKEIKHAQAAAALFGVKHLIVQTTLLNNSAFCQNTRERCYICKKMLFSNFKELAMAHGLKHVVDGSHADDVLEVRPGKKAAQELSILSPLEEAGLTKRDIRLLLKEFKLERWDRPSSPCLATRIQTYHQITVQQLRRIEEVEIFLRRSFDIKGHLRFRDWGSQSWIEVDKPEIIKIRSRADIDGTMKMLGCDLREVGLREYKPHGGSTMT